MKKLFYSLFCLVCIGLMTACLPSNDPDDGGDDNGGGNNNEATDNITPEQMKEKGFALKYDYFTEYRKKNIAVYTRKGSSTRLDIYYIDDEGKTEDHYVYIEAKDASGKYTGYGYYPDDDDESGWTDEDYRARQTANNAFSMISDMSEHFLQHGYEAKGTTTICGRKCNVYEGTYNRGSSILAVYDELGRDGKHGSFATWNGFALRAKCDIWGYDEATDDIVVTGEYTTFECTAIQIGVSDDAFSKTVDVTWIK